MDGALKRLPRGSDTRSFALGLALTVALVCTAGGLGSAYLLTVLTQVGVFALATLGLTILVGYAGQISFGHTIFLGLGGYLSALATTRWGIAPVPGMLLGVAASALAAVIIGWPTLRLRGHYLAMATFAVGLGFYAVAADTDVFNGFQGIAGIPPMSILGFELGDVISEYFLVWTFALVGVVAAWRLRRMRFGRSLRVLANDQAAAAGLGMDVHRLKVTAFVISAVFVSIAGSLQVHVTPFASPESYSFVVIIQLFVMLFIGGLGSVWGALIGALTVIGLPEVLGSAGDYEPTIYGVLLLVILLVRPTGLLAGPSPTSRRRPWRRAPRAGGAPETAGVVGT